MSGARAGRRAALRLAAALALVAVAGCGSDGGRAAPGPPDTSAPGVPGPATAGDEAGQRTTIAGVDVRLATVATVTGAAVDLAPRAGTDDLYVAEQAGRVRLLRAEGGGGYRLADEPVVDLTSEIASGGERGLLGIAFSPDGARLYVDFTDLDGNTHVVELPMVGDVADTSRRREVLFVEQPFPNHNGGGLVFGPDGLLYIGLGDGGSAGDPNGNGQDTSVLLGKVLRIDPTATADGDRHGVPADNPFAAGGGAPAVWLYGARNPWRFSFDPDTGDLWLADVGQSDVEEIDHLPASDGRDAGRGANLGWNLEEGSQPFRGATPIEGLVAPVFEYHHDGGNCSVIGGYVYRGEAIPDLRGVYVFADYCVGDVRGLLTGTDGAVLDERSLGAVSGPGLTAFGRDASGELYVLTRTGAVQRVLGI